MGVCKKKSPCLGDLYYSHAPHYSFYIFILEKEEFFIIISIFLLKGVYFTLCISKQSVSLTRFGPEKSHSHNNWR
ncbi:hypothetical protein BCV72DRAFT_224791 [Rhizopus microsporus var. microsporus]|uniref:Uncharacterized protein n=2 Tax=Rhizopus microsporus TaxID=58291 RepID=A0A2G4T7X7_RHIZD|nr:uncharacterized protein RHIMIDRAFT_252983 [Rhizopus microsporus ATCC 52813]ORE08644.1 hypothetical protein BCV72DRAFT_224791 [Rhizopus microsporus var. microsporus]PHZ17097.1 hypothetical protein RHIMIDRAFT_252983 [Rhizopus microsporus ATCC 52813]